MLVRYVVFSEILLNCWDLKSFMENGQLIIRQMYIELLDIIFRAEKIVRFCLVVNMIL